MGLYGGNKTTHKTTENPYDDQWIKDWISSAETEGSGISDQLTSLATHRDFQKADIKKLFGADTGFKVDIGDLTSATGTLRTDVNVLQDQLANWDTTTEVGDVEGLGDIIDNLKNKYKVTSGNVASLHKAQDAMGKDLRKHTASSIEGAIQNLGINNYLKKSDYQSNMSQNLNALGQALEGKWGEDIASLDLEGVRQSIADQGGDLSALTSDFAGLTSDMDWIKQLDLGGLDDRLNTQGTNLTNLITQQGENLQTQLGNQQTQWKGDLTDLQNILESGRGEALANLEGQLGKDRAADILNLKQQLESGTASDIELMAGNLRQEFGDDVFDLSTTFEGRLGDIQTALGGDISKLFKESGSLQTGLDTLTSDLGTTSQQLEALQGSFGDYKTDSATNLANVEAAFSKQLGDQSTDWTAKLGDLESTTAADILGLGGDISNLTTQTAADIAGAKSEAAAGLKELGTTVTEDRRKALSDLDTTWSANLQAQDKRLQTQFDEGSAAFNKRLSDISSSMNYRTLGDSAQGVKIRRSKAYNQGRTRSGTGQLGRSMKISTLNI